MKKTSEFGALFREIREGLGLSLREFCRRTGFDPANVSRLERGLLPPPKSQKLLTSYARGLRLKPKSPEWDRFMTLAKPPAEPRRGQGHAECLGELSARPPRCPARIGPAGHLPAR